MIPYTTPTFRVTIKGDVDLNEASEVYVTIAKGSTIVTKTGENVSVDETGRVVSCYMTQEESAQYRNGTAEVQVNWIYTDADGNIRRAATVPITARVGSQLYKQVIE